MQVSVTEYWAPYKKCRDNERMVLRVELQGEEVADLANLDTEEHLPDLKRLQRRIRCVWLGVWPCE